MSVDPLVDPLYVDPDGLDNVLGGAGWKDDSYHLSQEAAGPGQLDSDCVNAGSELIEDSDTDGSTATDIFPDEGTLDMGFHYPISRSTMKVTFTSIKNAIEKKNGQFKATYNLLGKVTLGNDSNGIDPDTQRVRVEIDTYIETLPLGACKQLSTKVWTCSRPSPGVTLLKIDLAKGTFEVIAKAVPAPAAPLASNVRLRLFIGDDIGVAEMLYVKGTLLAP